MIELLAALAVYRLASMIAYEDGPWDIFVRLRTRVYQRWAGTWLARGSDCPLCISFWLAWPIALLLPWRGLGMYCLTALALSAVTVLIVRLVPHDN